MLMTALIPQTNVAAMAAAGSAAAVASIARLPFTAVLLAVLLCSAAGLAVTTSAFVVAAVRLMLRDAVDQRSARRERQPKGAPA